MSAPFVPVAVTDRSGLDECWHDGAVVGLGPDGAIEFALGDPSVVVYPRSCNKPMQAIAMLRAGLDLPPRLLALVCASHLGEAQHVDGVRELLATAGLDERALGNTADLPGESHALADVLRAGGAAAPIYMNCSGKHAGMVVTCARRGWPIESYLERGHPLQQRVDEVISEFIGEPFTHVGVDGCGAPAHAMPLVALARAFRVVVLGEPRIHEAMTSYPHLVGGTGHDGTRFMQAIPGLLAKDGADGVYAAVMSDGRAVAVKIADGAARARPVVLAAALAALGVDVSAAADVWRVPVLGHGHPVGTVRPVGPLAHALSHFAQS